MIVFNALQSTLSGGIGRYCYELSRAVYMLEKIPFKIVIREEDRQIYNFVDNSDLIVINGVKNGPLRNYYEQFILPGMINKRYKNAVVHYPDSMAPVLYNNKTLITVHDLSFLSRKDDFKKTTQLWKKYSTDISMKKTNKIVSITNFTKQEIGKYYPKYLSKAEVVYNGFNDFSKAEIDLLQVRKEIKEKLEKPYIFTISTISPRKNIDGLIRAFNCIKDKIEHNLVIAGANGWLYENVYKLVNELKLNDRVYFLGKTTDNELKFLYKNSSLLVYPSFYEGFGLPPLEAMSYGIPCVVSNVTSIPEVVGDAALFVNPLSIEDISKKMLFILGNETERLNLSRRGELRIKNYSWNKCASDMIKIYEELM